MRVSFWRVASILPYTTPGCGRGLPGGRQAARERPAGASAQALQARQMRG